MDKQKICAKTLKILNNDTTKIKQDDNIKGNYYTYMMDTIYLSNNNEDRNTDAGKVIVICHECIHSIQSKFMHIENIIFSNLELIFSIILIILMFEKNNWTLITAIGYLVILLSSIIIRVILERDAVNNSFNLAKKLILYENLDIESDEVEVLRKKSHKLKVFFYISLFWKKLVKILFMIAIFYILK